MKAFAEHSERLGRSDDGERVEVVAKCAVLELVGRVLDPAVFFLLLEIGLLVGRAARAEALLDRPRRVGLALPVLALLAGVMRLGAQGDLRFVPRRWFDDTPS